MFREKEGRAIFVHCMPTFLKHFLLFWYIKMEFLSLESVFYVILYP